MEDTQRTAYHQSTQYNRSSLRANSPLCLEMLLTSVMVRHLTVGITNAEFLRPVKSLDVKLGLYQKRFLPPRVRFESLVPVDVGIAAPNLVVGALGFGSVARAFDLLPAESQPTASAPLNLLNLWTLGMKTWIPAAGTSNQPEPNQLDRSHQVTIPAMLEVAPSKRRSLLRLKLHTPTRAGTCVFLMGILVRRATRYPRSVKRICVALGPTFSIFDS